MLYLNKNFKQFKQLNKTIFIIIMFKAMAGVCIYTYIQISILVSFVLVDIYTCIYIMSTMSISIKFYISIFITYIYINLYLNLVFK